LFGEKFGSFDVDVSLQKTNIDMGNPWKSTMKTDHFWNWLAEKSPTSALGELQQTSGASEISRFFVSSKGVTSAVGDVSPKF